MWKKKSSVSISTDQRLSWVLKIYEQWIELSSLLLDGQRRRIGAETVEKVLWDGRMKVFFCFFFLLLGCFEKSSTWERHRHWRSPRRSSEMRKLNSCFYFPHHRAITSTWFSLSLKPNWRAVKFPFAEKITKNKIISQCSSLFFEMTERNSKIFQILVFRLGHSSMATKWEEKWKWTLHFLTQNFQVLEGNQSRKKHVEEKVGNLISDGGRKKIRGQTWNRTHDEIFLLNFFLSFLVSFVVFLVLFFACQIIHYKWKENWAQFR